MNIFLQFKKKTHAEAYDHDLEIQVTKRLWMVIVMTVINVISMVSTWILAKRVSMATYDATKRIAIFVLLVGLCVLKWKFHRVKKYLGKINFVLDVILMYFSFIPFPLIGENQFDPLTSLGTVTLMWSISLICFTSTYAIANWWLRALGPIIQVIYFFVPTVIREKYWSLIVISAVQCLVLYGGYIYVYELFQRKDFLEKRKVYENYEAIKQIFDDIIQGVMIVDPNYKPIYSNRTFNTMFNVQKSKHSLETLFSQILVKRITPHMELLVTEQIQMSQDTSEPQYPLRDYVAMISKALFDPNSPEPSVTSESSWLDPTSHLQQKQNFSIKFTTSLFMNQKVIVINVTDTTDRDALIAAQAASEYKTRLLSSVSHELRTPLNGSINFIEESLIDTTIPSSTKDKWLIPALRSNRLLLSLVNDILDFSQMHSGQLRMVFESRSVADTARECLELLELQAKKKALKLTLENNISPDQEVIVTDHNRVRQVMLNLLSNAVKFTFNGGVSLILDPVSVEIPRRNQTEGTYALKGVRVTCKDTGIGISPEDQKKLFKAFVKIDLGTKAFINSTGAGLGLLISNSLVQRLSPEDLPDKESNIIRFESKVDEGTSVFFEVFHHVEKEGKVQHVTWESSPDDRSVFSEHGLEMRNVEELSRTPISLSLANRSSRGLILRDSKSPGLIQLTTNNLIGTLMSIPSQIQLNCKCPRVLIVDDDPFNLTALEQILSRLKVSCDTAFNGKEAIEKIQIRQHNRCSLSCQQYKVMFLDCNMPVLDGFETARRIRAMEKGGEIDRIKIIACTAFVQQSDENAAREAGMDDFSTKPIKFEVIKEKLKASGFFEK